eukprot:gnl/TRDRNA2_/TRDRNA2_140496_c0_seq1.p1 gnl/TRDRNA2_/TRDRNA2_140496_c0~~gnl/TRDRNA2_/TRDRNA2_140496_c0_seq1.p1  ORF type:complete len:217 (-),score=37.62 gnl/TRDRNA2_/TRDRNA2_140496_c0_seq1:54-704(-)
MEGEEAISAPGAPWSAFKAGTKQTSYARLQAPHRIHPLPWGLRGSVALLDLGDGDGGPFWEEYFRLLPAPETFEVPIMMPFPRLKDMDPNLAEEVQIQRDELRACCSALESSDDEGLSMCGIVWAAACISSRSFTIAPDLHAFCPFVDMINHAAVPNAIVVTQHGAAERLDEVQGGCLTLVATRNMAEGEEISISYGSNADSDEFFMRYGFRMPSC